MSKIIFIPPMDLYERNKPIGVLSLATILKDLYEVEVLNYFEIVEKNIFKNKFQDVTDLLNLAKYICGFNPTVVGFSSTCTDFHFHIYLAKLLKEINSNIKIVFGGLQATMVAEEALKEYSWIDAIGLGECESNIKDLVYGLIVNDLSAVPGVAYRTSSNEIKMNYDYLLTENLDDMHFIDFDFLSFSGTEYINIETGRGCPFNCSYCFSSTIHKHKYRTKSNKRLVEEIKRSIDKYNCRNFGFVHDLFTYNRNSVLEFCRILKENNLDIKWKTSARIDTIDEELIIEMKNAGLQSLFFGIESGSSKIQKDINKNLKIDQIFKTIDMLKKIGMIDPAFSFMYGFETENEEDLKATLDIIAYLINNRFSNFRIYRLTVFNGTQVYDKLNSHLGEQETKSGAFHIHNYYTECTKEIYLDKKSMFPYTFKLDVEIIRKYPQLDIFINRIVATLVKYLSKTSKILFSSGEKILELYNLYEEYLQNNNYCIDELNIELIFGYMDFIMEKGQNEIVLPIYLYEKNIQLLKQGLCNKVSFKTRIDIIPIIRRQDSEIIYFNEEVEVIMSKNNNKVEIYYE